MMRRGPVSLCLRRSLVPDSLSGPLISNVPKSPNWMKEVEAFDSETLATNPTRIQGQSYKRFVPDSALEWKRVDDREAGEDEGLVRHGILHDTHLCKADSTSYGIVTIKTAGIDSIIDVISTNKDVISHELWGNILARVEYLSSTLSVKSIRLFLEEVSRAKLDQFPREHTHSMIEAIGQELLCRFHSLSLLSCSSIAHSMSLIPGARHEGTLNILSLAFKQNIGEVGNSVPHDALLSMTVRFLRAYASMDYLIPVVFDATTGILRNLNYRFSVQDRLDMIRLIGDTGSDSPYVSAILPANGGEFGTATADQVLELLRLALSSPNAELESIARTVVASRVEFVNEPAAAVLINGGDTGMKAESLRISPELLKFIEKMRCD